MSLRCGVNIGDHSVDIVVFGVAWLSVRLHVMLFIVIHPWYS